MEIKDLEAVEEIYNHAIRAKFSTAHTEPIGMEERKKWFAKHDRENYPVYVFEENGKVLGWISISPYREGRLALRSTAEISYYVHPRHHRGGIGSRLVEQAIRIAPGINIKNLVAILLEPNVASIALLRKFGFERWGDMPGLAEIDGREYNHQYYGLRLKDR